ncbi:pirin family protein [Kitasatospora sp. NPDC088134]|uniref:pirin family protein n=1 Tax=Kitasatospora sp. NPDC088134 TaxID=3364071 RepID=UPI0037FF3A2B
MSTTGNGAAEVLPPRDVPLGGARAMTVRRTLPQRERTLIGAWCFVDHYGPDDVAVTGGMDVPPHPHIGLQTATWLFSGKLRHRDSNGVHEDVLPGELNLMTAGRGIAHSETSTPETTVLHGVQLWIALPDAHRHTGRAFHHHVPRPVPLPGGGEARVFLGTLAGETSPVPTFSPLLGAEIHLPAGATTTLDLDPAFEHGLLVDAGEIRFAGTPLRPDELGHLPTGHPTATLTNTSAEPARLVLLGGTPFGEEIVMWWNFVARTGEEIVQARLDWEKGDRFGEVTGYPGDRLPAPELPNATLKARGNRH